MTYLDCSASGAKPALLMAIANISSPSRNKKFRGFFGITFLEAVSVLKISGPSKFIIRLHLSAQQESFGRLYDPMFSISTGWLMPVRFD